MLTEAEAVAAYGDGAVSDELWAEYARERPHVAPSAAAEAAAALERNAAAIVRDAEKQLALPPGTKAREYEAALRAVTAALLDDDAVDDARRTPFHRGLPRPPRRAHLRAARPRRAARCGHPCTAPPAVRRAGGRARAARAPSGRASPDNVLVYHSISIASQSPTWSFRAGGRAAATTTSSPPRLGGVVARPFSHGLSPPAAA